MATIKKIIRGNTISQFTQVAPDGGSGFRLLADGLNELYGRVAPVALDEMEARGKEVGRNAAKKQIGNKRSPQANVNSIDLIKGFEGFIGGAKHDVNALRLGHGSDTITAADGSIKKVKAGDTVTREDADRDLNRRVSTEFAPKARKAIGEDRFDAMSESQQAAVTSIAYNYGNVPQRILGALKNGTDEEISQAIQGLGGDNDGINRVRRNKEAEIFLNGGNQVVSKNAQQSEVLVRTSDGKLEGRLFSPYSGPLLQAHNAAAGIAFQSEIMEQGAIDLQNISNDFALDPDGYAQAADGYIGNIVEQAPDHFKSDIRDVLESEVTRRRLGIMDAKQSDTRARANNSSKALVARWSAQLSEAIAAGNEGEAEAARIRLDSILQAREALPGVAWTEEQSANVFLASARDAQSIRGKARTEFGKGVKDQLDTIIKAAKNGQTGADESILTDPNAMSTNPELAREAQAFVLLRESLPEFNRMTPDEQDAALLQMRDAPVGEEFQVDIQKAAELAADENRKAWDDDSIKRAGEVMDVPPPPLPDFTTSDPQKFVEALTERKNYGNDLFDDGFTDVVSFLSQDEADGIKAMMGRDVPPEARAALSAAIVAGFGNDAARVFSEIKGDPLTMYAGKLMASGGKAATSAEMLRGQQMMDEGLVVLPPNASVIEVYDTDIAEAMVDIPGALNAQKQTMLAASALYAARSAGIDPKSQAAKDLMAEVMQEALGQSENKRGDVTGGVQEIMGRPTLLPVGVSGEQADQALHLALTGLPFSDKGLSHLRNFGSFLTGGLPDKQGINTDAFEGRTPTVRGEPITQSLVEDGNIRIVTRGGSEYFMQAILNGAVVDVRDESGTTLFFDLNKLIEATQ